MHRILISAISAVFFLTAALWGCAGSTNIEDSIPPTLATVKPAGGLTKKIAVALTQAPPTALGERMGGLFLNTLVRSMRTEDRQLIVLTDADEAFPVIMDRIAQQPSPVIDAIELSRHGRQGGYNGLVSAALRGIRSYTKKSGFLWFRKVRYFISFDLTVDLYDPMTAAKIVGAVEEASVKVSEFEYEAFQDNIATDVKNLEEAVVKFGEELGELVAESLQKRFWMTSVVNIEGDLIYLPAGRGAGLKPGARLAVFEGRRMMDGLAQEQFIVPGPQIATIQVSSVAQDGAQAVALDGSPIQLGDIAVPVK